MSGCMSHKLVITVKEVRGNCEAGFKVGDRIVFIGDNVIKGEVKCLYGINAIWALLHTLGYGGKIPESSPLYNRRNDTYLGCCPDPTNLVVFEIKREGIYWRTPESEYSEEMHSFVPLPESLINENEGGK